MVDFAWYDEQLYSMLSAKCIDSNGALGTVQLLKEEIRSAKSVIGVAAKVAQAAGEDAQVTPEMVETSKKEVEECEIWAGKEGALLSGLEEVEEQQVGMVSSFQSSM